MSILWQTMVRFFTPCEPEAQGTNKKRTSKTTTKANEKLGWKPTYDLPALVKEMVASDLDLFKKEKHLRDHGFAHKNEIE